MVPNNAEWYHKVPSDAERCGMVRNGAEQCRTVPNGAERCQKVPKGAKWCGTMLNGAEQCRTVPNGAKLCHQNYFGAHHPFLPSFLCPLKKRRKRTRIQIRILWIRIGPSPPRGLGGLIRHKNAIGVTTPLGVSSDSWYLTIRILS